MGKTKKQNSFELETKDTLAQVADKLVASTKSLMSAVKTEEDLRIGFEKILEPLGVEIGISLQSKYEKSIYKGRLDALHGQVIIEYEPPFAFRSPKSIARAFEQLIDYIKGETKERKETFFVWDPKLVGVGFDGEQIFFVRYQGDKAKPEVKLDKRDFKILGPYPFDQQTARTLLTYLRVLSRKLLIADKLQKYLARKVRLLPKQSLLLQMP